MEPYDKSRTRGQANDTTERRRENRWPCGAEVAVMPLSSEGGFLEARVLDFSDHGLGLLLGEPIRPGEQLIVKVKLERMIMLCYTARNCAREEGRYRIGAEFTGIIGSPDERPETLRAAFIDHLEAQASAKR